YDNTVFGWSLLPSLPVPLLLKLLLPFKFAQFLGLESLPVLLTKPGDYLVGADTTISHGREHIIQCIEIVLFQHYIDPLVLEKLAVLKTLRFELPLDIFFSSLYVLFPVFLLEPLSDFVAGLRALDDIEPVPARPVDIGRCEYLDDISVLQLII